MVFILEMGKTAVFITLALLGFGGESAWFEEEACGFEGATLVAANLGIFFLGGAGSEEVVAVGRDGAELLENFKLAAGRAELLERKGLVSKDGGILTVIVWGLVEVVRECWEVARTAREVGSRVT